MVEKLGKPYDLRCTRGTEERHVEVKGTTGAATSVEDLHARDKDDTVDLYVAISRFCDSSVRDSDGFARLCWSVTVLDAGPTVMDTRARCESAVRGRCSPWW
ncbi:hypothetical protein SUDANB58_00003 [Streptomyces sp. enrichment culture]|uniref:hypothetical protein n=1 Tax=Streptomyces sp. enrichment culture TaxID=1795815 RepID=UPI003F55FB65